MDHIRSLASKAQSKYFPSHDKPKATQVSPYISCIVRFLSGGSLLIKFSSLIKEGKKRKKKKQLLRVFITPV